MRRCFIAPLRMNVGLRLSQTEGSTRRSLCTLCVSNSVCVICLSLCRCQELFFSDSLHDSLLSVILSPSTMPLYTLTITHSHTLPITCTCCYDEIKGIQDQDFSCSFSDSLSLWICLSECLSLCGFVTLRYLLTIQCEQVPGASVRWRVPNVA